MRLEYAAAASEVGNVYGVNKETRARRSRPMTTRMKKPTMPVRARNEAQRPMPLRRGGGGGALLLAVIGVLLILWVLPIGLAYSPLHIQPLALAAPGINGTIVSRLRVVRLVLADRLQQCRSARRRRQCRA